MLVVHYTTESNWNLKPIKILNGYRGDGSHDKPLGALWTSPSQSKYGWRNFCREDRESDMPAIKIDLEISEEKMLIIKKAKDLYNLPLVEHPRGWHWIDFEELLQTYDSIWLTRKGVWETKMPLLGNNDMNKSNIILDMGLNTWDCETVCILNEKCITKWWRSNG